MYTVDGKQVLAAHSLFTVDEFALDRVKLVGAHPSAVKGKYVDVTVAQWDVMFKIVNGSQSDHAHRVARAVAHHEQLILPSPSTHPSYLILPAMHTEDTSSRMKRKTNTVFDVRGRATLLGDFARGCEWPDTDTMAIVRVTVQDLSSASWFVTQGDEDTPSPVCTMSPEHYRNLAASGFMQPTSCIDKKCMRVMGFIRVVPDEDIDTQLAIEDPFFAVVYVLDTRPIQTSPS